MHIGIIGSGHIGGTLARLLVDAGYVVALSNSRGPASLEDTVQSLGSRARAATAKEAARFGEVVVEAIPFGHYEALPAEVLADTILVSASNYYPQRDGRIAELGGDTAITYTELVARHASEARVVKAFNTIYWEHLRDQGDSDKPLDARRVIPLAGDDAEAKATVGAIVQALGFAPLDLGGLRDGGRRMQPGTPIYNRNVTRAEARALLGAT